MDFGGIVVTILHASIDRLCITKLTPECDAPQVFGNRDRGPEATV
jgi:hypothetical protein